MDKSNSDISLLHTRETNIKDILYKYRLLILIIIFAFFIRLWGIWNAESNDEYNEVFEALRVCSGQLNYERWFKRFYLYILSIEYGLFYAIGWISHIFSSPTDFAAKIIRDLSPLLLIGRATSTVMGALSVFMTYVVGSRLHSKNVGLLAALFLSLNSFNIILSHYARLDTTLCSIVLISFYFIVRIYQRADSDAEKYYAFAGLFIGIAIQNKIPSVILLIPFAVAHLISHGFKFSPQLLFGRQVAFFVAALMSGLVVGNPAILFAPIKFLQGMLSQGDAFTVAINETKSEYIGYLAYIFYFFRELGMPLSVLALFSLWKALTSRNNNDILLLSFILPFYALMGASRYMVYDSYMIPLMPFLYILCSDKLISMLDKFNSRIMPKSWVLGGVVLVLICYPSFNVGKLLLSFSGQNTRYMAKYWIEQNIPFDSKILMDSGKTMNSFAPLIAQNRESILRTISELSVNISNGTINDPTKMVDYNAVKYYQMLLQTVPKEAYDITSTKFGLELKSLNYYKQEGYKYFVISESMKINRSDRFTAERHPDVYRFYSALDIDPNLKLIKIIAPSIINRGERFYIYKVL